MMTVGKTCYLSVVLHVLNIAKRFVLTWLMQDPFPFKATTFSSVVKTFMFEYRKLNFDPQSISNVLAVLKEGIPE